MGKRWGIGYKRSRCEKLGREKKRDLNLIGRGGAWVEGYMRVFRVFFRSFYKVGVRNGFEGFESKRGFLGSKVMTDYC